MNQNQNLFTWKDQQIGIDWASGVVQVIRVPAYQAWVPQAKHQCSQKKINVS
jgi:hypothetical protein